MNRLLPADLAALLEDLGRQERRELLDVVEPAVAADALESMHPDKQRQLLTETGPPRAADLVALMEPDEAARALRGLIRQQRDRLLGGMFDDKADALRSVMAFDPHTAGGVMNTALVIASVTDTVEHVRITLRAKRHVADLDAVVVVDDQLRPIGRILADDVLQALLPGLGLPRLPRPRWPS